MEGLVYQPLIQSLLERKPEYTQEESISNFISPLEKDDMPFPVEPVKIDTFGITDLNDRYSKVYKTNIISEQSEPTVTRGKTIFKSDDINVGNMKEFLDKLEENGISVKVTSGVRKNNKSKSGDKSYHIYGNAIDITPIDGSTKEHFTKLLEQIKSKPKLVEWMRENGYGIIDETDPLIKARTGATGNHWHVSRGGERLALFGFNKLFS